MSNLSNTPLIGNHLSTPATDFRKNSSIPIFENPSVMALMERSMMYQPDSDIKFNPKMEFRL